MNKQINQITTTSKQVSKHTKINEILTEIHRQTNK